MMSATLSRGGKPSLFPSATQALLPDVSDCFLCELTRGSFKIRGIQRRIHAATRLPDEHSVAMAAAAEGEDGGGSAALRPPGGGRGSHTAALLDSTTRSCLKLLRCQR